jgi:peptidoglycan/xylan/chitin deacetylase (PgdA/CDA1 family)
MPNRNKENLEPEYPAISTLPDMDNKNFSVTHIKIFVILVIVAITIAIFIASATFKMRFSDPLQFLEIQFKSFKNAYTYANLEKNPIKLFAYLLNGVPPNNEKYKTPAISIPVLLYHGAIDEPDDSGVNVTEEIFRNHIFALKRAGYETINTEQLLAFMRGELTLPERTIAITFDDGRYDSYEPVDPLLKLMGYKAIMFIISSYSLDNPSDYYLDADDILRMERSGRWDIEAHTHAGHERILPEHDHDHKEGQFFFGDKLYKPGTDILESDEEFTQRIISDFERVKSELEGLTKKPINSFAVPFGNYGQHLTNFPQAKNIVPEIASRYFRMIFYQDAPGTRFTQNYFLDKKANDPIFMIRRINAGAISEADELLKILENGNTKQIPFIDDFSEDRGWIKSWGNLNFNGEMSLSAKSNETAAATVLDGSRAWENYEVKSTIKTPSLTSTVVWVRFQDDDNNLACNFNNGFAHIVEVINGVRSVIRGVEDPSIILPGGDFTVKARVSGRNLECYLNDRLLISTSFIDPKLDKGGIGFSTWSPEPGRSRLIVKEIQILEI